MKRSGTQHPQSKLPSPSLMPSFLIKLNPSNRPPICRIRSILNIAMKAGIGLIARRTDQAMVYGVIVDVINMLAEVGFIANLVLPKSLLPDGMFAFAQAGEALALSVSVRTAQAKLGFDAFPARRKIGVVFGQGPDAADVIGQDNNGVNSEWRFCFDAMEGLTE